ncbi:MAG: hypothetical protein JO128_09765 [Alphaproteobacteria bacterium]|nr:hypothetical protein [Alphaproteobacteria bacterium]
MTTPINPTSGTPIQRPTTDKSKPQSTSAASSDTFTVSTDTVQTQGNLSFGSLRPLINTQLTSQTAATTAQQTGKQLGSQSLPVVNNRPQVVSNLIDTLQGQGNNQG